MRIKRKQSGQGMTEYIAIAALNAVAAIAAYQFFGQTVRSQMGGIAQEVSGTSAAAAINSAQTQVANAATEVLRGRDWAPARTTNHASG